MLTFILFKFYNNNMTNLDSILKSRDITLPTKVRLVKAMVFPVVMYGCESWTVKKAAAAVAAAKSLQSCLFVTLWTASCQALASLSFTISWSLLKLMSIESVTNHLILCHPLLLLPSIFPSIRVFSKESALCIRCPNCWSFKVSELNVHDIF